MPRARRPPSSPSPNPECFHLTRSRPLACRRSGAPLVTRTSARPHDRGVDLRSPDQPGERLVLDRPADGLTAHSGLGSAADQRVRQPRSIEQPCDRCTNAAWAHLVWDDSLMATLGRRIASALGDAVAFIFEPWRLPRRIQAAVYLPAAVIAW